MWTRLNAVIAFARESSLMVVSCTAKKHFVKIRIAVGTYFSGRMGTVQRCLTLYLRMFLPGLYVYELNSWRKSHKLFPFWLGNKNASGIQILFLWFSGVLWLACFIPWKKFDPESFEQHFAIMGGVLSKRTPFSAKCRGICLRYFIVP